MAKKGFLPGQLLFWLFLATTCCAATPGIQLNTIAWDPGAGTLIIDMQAIETLPFTTVKGVELEIRSETNDAIYQSTISEKDAGWIEHRGQLHIKSIVEPLEWINGTYTAWARAKGKKPTPWVPLAEIEYSDQAAPILSPIVSTNKFGKVRLSFFHARENKAIPNEDVIHVTLITLQPEKPKGIVHQWPGDLVENTTYDEISSRVIRLNSLNRGTLELTPGFYRIRHNSVYGNPPVGMYGKSEIFEIKQGKTINIQIALIPAV